MSDDHSDSQRRLLIRATERAVALAKTILTWGRPLRYRTKIQSVVANGWIEGYLQAVEDLKANMKETER